MAGFRTGSSASPASRLREGRRARRLEAHADGVRADGPGVCAIEQHEGPEMTKAVIDILGDGVLMYESDFPHPECYYPNSTDNVISWGTVIGEEALRKLMADNAARYLRLLSDPWGDDGDDRGARSNGRGAAVRRRRVRGRHRRGRRLAPGRPRDRGRGRGVFPAVPRNLDLMNLIHRPEGGNNNMRRIWKRLRVPLTALFVLALVAASCGDDEADEPVAAVDAAALDAAEAGAASAEADAATARAEADAAAAAAAEAEAALAEAMAAAGTDEGVDPAAVAELEAQLQAAQDAATAAESRAEEAEAAAEEAAMAVEEETEEEVAAPTGDPGSVTIAVTTEPNTLDPQSVNDRNSRVVTSNLFESLLGRDSTGALVPVLATSRESVDADIWRFQIREGVTFHDGQALNAQAAADSLNRMLDPDYPTQRASYIDGIVRAEVVGEFTLDIHTDSINAVLEAQVAQLPVIAPGTGETVGRNPVGTGPYKFESWDSRPADYCGAQSRLLGRGTVDRRFLRALHPRQSDVAGRPAGR